jgi:glycoside/pentoside/hexuronide:cation symporter, GPH family
VAPTTAVAPERLSFRTKFLYGFGSISFGVHVYVLSLLLFFYNQVVGVPPGLVSLALGATLVIDAVWDPILGQFSDRLRTPWGRRHPLMYASAIPVALTMLALWRPPAAFSGEQKALWLFVFVLAARLVISLYEVPSQALAPELVPEYHERTGLLGYRWIFFTLGGAVATMSGYFIFFRPTAQYPQGQLNPSAWGPLTITATIMMVGSILISALGTHDRIKTLHQPPPRQASFGVILREVFATLRNWNLGVALTASLIGGVSYGIYLGLQLYVDTFFWRLPASSVGVLSLANLVSLLPGAWVAAVVSRRFGKKYACVGFFLLSLVFLQGPILLRMLGAFPDVGTAAYLPTLFGVRFMHGILTNAAYIVVTSMIADITEDAQVKTGARSEGLLMATNSFVVKVTSGFAAVLPGVMLAAVHFPARATAAVSPEAVRNLMWIYLPSTVALSAASILTWLLYRIDQQTHERNLATVAAAAAAEEAQGEAAPIAAAG